MRKTNILLYCTVFSLGLMLFLGGILEFVPFRYYLFFQRKQVDSSTPCLNECISTANMKNCSLESVVNKIKNKQYKDAIEAIDHYLKKNNQLAELHYWKGRAFLGLEEYDKASNSLLQAVNMDIFNPDYSLWLARCGTARHMDDSSIRILSFVLEKNNINSLLYAQRALAYSLSGMHEEAEKDIQTAVAIAPSYCRVLYIKAVVLANKEKYDEAVKILQELLLKHEEGELTTCWDAWGSDCIPIIHATLALIFLDKCNYDTALESINRAILLAPSDNELFFIRALVYRFIDKQKALEDITHAEKLSPIQKNKFEQLRSIIMVQPQDCGGNALEN